MQVNLDQIEFYYGPSPKKPRSTLASTSERRPALAHVRQPFRRSFFPTETVFIQNGPATANTADAPAPLTHEWSSTGITKPRNAFDVAITNFYGGAASQPQAITEDKSLVTSDIPGTLETSLDLTNCSLSLSEPPAFEDFTTPTSPTNELEQASALSGNILITIDEATSRHSLSPAAASESASNASGSLSLCGDSRQEPDNHDTHEPPCSPDQDRNPCLTTINATEQSKNPEAAKGKSMPSCQPYQSNARSNPGSVSITTQSVDRPESYPSIAVVVPAPPWARGKATRATTRVAAMTCKKRLRSGRDSDNHQDPEVSIPEAIRQRPKKKSKPTTKSFRHSLGVFRPHSMLFFPCYPRGLRQSHPHS